MDDGMLRDMLLLVIFVCLGVMALCLARISTDLNRIADVYAPRPVIEEVLPATD